MREPTVFTQRGFTYPELIVIMGVVSMLFGFITVNLLSIQHKASINATTTMLISDIKSQQIKAMVGEKETGLTGASYGIYFEQNRYILFVGPVYLPTEPSNFPINLEQNMQFTNIAFPNATLVFSQGSGEVSTFIEGASSVTLKKTVGNEQKTIVINRYGVITSVL